ncbi:MAG: hypothetical protein V7L23_13255 [Nostoc sp.]|uniref:hypothetical protein n=1 Tax=Nostoc sp. TaxID=1180 RepID=UPI002FEF0551
MREIAYSMDLRVPGFYVWFYGFNLRIGGAVPEDDPYPYPGKIHSPAGIALVLPKGKIFTTYRRGYSSKHTRTK